MPDLAASQEQQPDQRNSRWRIIATLALYFLLMLVADRLSIKFFIPQEITPWYLPAGLTFAVLLLLGLRTAPVVFFAVLATSFLVRGRPLSMLIPDIIIALLVAVLYGMAAYLLRWVLPINQQFRHTRDVVRFISVALGTAFVVGAACTANLLAFHRIPASVYFTTLLNWWIGDVIGIMTLTPFIVVQYTLHREPKKRPESIQSLAVLEEMAWVGSIIIIEWFAFASPLAPSFHLFYLVFLPLIWYALRHSIYGATLAILVISLSVMITTLAVGLIPLGKIDIQIFLLSISLTGLMLGAVVNERRLSEQALARERAFLSTAIDLLPFPIIFTTSSGEVLRANQASCRFFDSEDPAVWWDATLLTADMRVLMPLKEWLMMCAARGEVMPANEGVISLPDGHEVPVQMYSTPIYLEGMPVASVVAFMDITQLKEADRAKNRFLDVLSHEMKTPVTSILGWAQAAQHDPAIVPQALEVIARNARRFGNTLDDLVDVSRLLHGKLALRRERIDLWKQVEITVEYSKPAMQEHHQTLNMIPPSTSLIVDADPARLRQVIRNLVDNAIKFTGAGGTITLTAWSEGQEAVVSVHDTGRGISPNMLSALFQAFSQPHRTEATGGLGMGLMLVKSLVELQGGHVFVSSPGEGLGSTFIIRLPLAIDDNCRDDSERADH
ncbi:MAG: MASE1 domain-containing protein [Armatimonadota bacterium]